MPADHAIAVRDDAPAADAPIARFPAEEFCRAIERGDFDTMLSFCTDDVAFTPMGSENLTFRGPERNRVVWGSLLEVSDSFEYTGQRLYSHDTVALPLRATIGKFTIRAMDVVKVDGQGRATEIVVYGRPYLPVSVLAGRDAAILIRPFGRLTWLGFRILLWPLEMAQRLAGPVGLWMAEAGVERGLRKARRRGRGY
jgi:ketosteroid isomerase-like protein